MRWIALLAGPILWAVHFTAAYGIASLSIQLAGEVTGATRAVLAAVTAILVLAALLLALPSRKAGMLGDFAPAIRTTGCILAAIAIAWQSLPLLLQS
jgi:hypothetical protein